MESLRSRTEVTAVIETCAGLQRSPTSFESRRHDADRIHVEVHKATVSNARGNCDFRRTTGCGQLRTRASASARVARASRSTRGCLDGGRRSITLLGAATLDRREGIAAHATGNVLRRGFFGGRARQRRIASRWSLLGSSCWPSSRSTPFSGCCSWTSISSSERSELSSSAPYGCGSGWSGGAQRRRPPVRCSTAFRIA
jgi:hypothetical protein